MAVRFLRDIVDGVQVDVVVVQLEVQMKAGGIPGIPHLRDGVAHSHRLSGGGVDAAAMRVQRGIAVPVIHHHIVAVAAAAVVAALPGAAGQDDLAAFDGKDGAIVKS